MSESPRVPEADIHSSFLARWSPRAFGPTPLTDAEVHSLFEAARWAPSSANQQPWLFLYARAGSPELERFQSLLNPFNAWAKNAPLLIYAFARRLSIRGGENPTADFDTGAAWMSLALQAEHLGLVAHGMGGFDHEKSYEVLGVPADRYRVLAAIAIGHLGDKGMLSPELQQREQPSQRKPLAEIAIAGNFKEPVVASS